VNWKTSVAGVVALLLSALQAAHEPSLTAAIHDPVLQMSIVMGVLGLLAKDFNVTGGNVGQPSTKAALEQANQAASAANPPSDKAKP
jgi:NAD/NADP transhydrogenase alpha subunit